MESSSFCQLVSEKVTKPVATSKPWASRAVSSLPGHKPLMLTNGSNQANTSAAVPKPVFQPRQRHTAEELDAMRSKGICFKCKGKYFRGHVCPLKKLQILTVVDSIELEVLEEDLLGEEELLVTPAPVLRC